MLTLLRIKNLALVEDLTLELPPGFSAITGETGAGKSLLIGALHLLLGQRADRSALRAGCDSGAVEAVFDSSAPSPSLCQFLDENGWEPGEAKQLILRRTLTASGTNRQFINGTPVTLQSLSSLGDWLVDIHGPYDHQSLLHPARQLDILDAFAHLDPLRQDWRQALRRRAELLRQKTDLVTDETQYAQQLDLLRFQCQEIESAHPRAGELDTLEPQYHRAANCARLLAAARSALQALAEDEQSLLGLAGQIGRRLHELEQIDPSARPLGELHELVVSQLQELQHGLSQYTDRLDLDPQGLQQLEERLNVLRRLQRKYGPSLDDVIAFGRSARKKLQTLLQRDDELARIRSALDRVEQELQTIGGRLSSQRQRAIPRLQQTVQRQLADLGFRQCHFTIDLQASPAGALPPDPLAPSGLDTIEFRFAPNPGEPARSLRGIASSGEMARVMLALKTVLAAEDQIPVLVFDEIDANVGGETALEVGRKLRELGRNRQVLCITHLAPVAAFAATHFLVQKQIKKGRSLSLLSRLSPTDRVGELARMLGSQTAAARQHAAALLESAQAASPAAKS